MALQAREVFGRRLLFLLLSLDASYFLVSLIIKKVTPGIGLRFGLGSISSLPSNTNPVLKIFLYVSMVTGDLDGISR